MTLYFSCLTGLATVRGNELIRTRTGEGKTRAVARGVRLERKPKLTGHQRREAIAFRKAGEVLARALSMSVRAQLVVFIEA